MSVVACAHARPLYELYAKRLREFTKDDELCKKIPALSQGARRKLLLEIENLWADDEDDVPAADAPPESPSAEAE